MGKAQIDITIWLKSDAIFEYPFIYKYISPPIYAIFGQTVSRGSVEMFQGGREVAEKYALYNFILLSCWKVEQNIVNLCSIFL